MTATTDTLAGIKAERHLSNPVIWVIDLYTMVTPRCPNAFE